MQDQPRRFSTPCDTEDSGACIIVRDHSGRALSYLAPLLQKGSYAEAVDCWLVGMGLAGAPLAEILRDPRFG